MIDFPILIIFILAIRGAFAIMNDIFKMLLGWSAKGTKPNTIDDEINV